jgi:hypothetical protein
MTRSSQRQQATKEWTQEATKTEEISVEDGGIQSCTTYPVVEDKTLSHAACSASSVARRTHQLHKLKSILLLHLTTPCKQTSLTTATSSIFCCHVLLHSNQTEAHFSCKNNALRGHTVKQALSCFCHITKRSISDPLQMDV